MDAGTERLLARFNGHPPVDVDTLARFSSESSVELPLEYARFLRQANGGEGFIGNAYVILWRLEELLPFNKQYQVEEYAPGLLLFGSDGGGEAFAFDTRAAGKPIVSVPFIGMELDEARPVGENFDRFLETMFES